MATAKLFQNGRSQAVRLPKEFRLQGKEVKISKQGNKNYFKTHRKFVGTMVCITIAIFG